MVSNFEPRLMLPWCALHFTRRAFDGYPTSGQPCPAITLCTGLGVDLSLHGKEKQSRHSWVWFKNHHWIQYFDHFLLRNGFYFCNLCTQLWLRHNWLDSETISFARQGTCSFIIRLKLADWSVGHACWAVGFVQTCSSWSTSYLDSFWDWQITTSQNEWMFWSGGPLQAVSRAEIVDHTPRWPFEERDDTVSHTMPILTISYYTFTSLVHRVLCTIPGQSYSQ